MNDFGFSVNMLPLKSGTSSSGSSAAAQAYGTMTVAAAALTGKLPPPANAAAAAGNSPLQVPQAAMVVGEPIPVVFGRRRGNVGGVLVFPKATEARFENSSTTITARYHCVLGEGLLGDVEVRDVRQGECRPGAVYSQNYNQRAGSWAAGNVATAQSGYTVPAFPSFTGGGGNYQGLSTIEFSGTYAGGSDQWRTAWNVFVRNGLVIERGRLLDSTAGSSDNIADLILWALQRSGRVPNALIDFDSLTAAARFVEANGLWCNGEFSSSTNLGDWLIKLLPDFLLRETKVAGKFGLRPLLPTNSDGSINTGTITPAWSLTEAAIIPGSLQIEYAEASSRRPVAMALLWRQQQDATDVPIVRSLAVGDVNASGPVEQHDLSQYATTENHAVKVGAYLYARRTLSTHTATVRLKAGSQTGTIAQGDIVQVYLQNTSSRELADVFNRYYQVESVAQAISGEETLQLSHFPVDSSGRSLIALAVTRASGPGQVLSSNRTGGGCDVAGASANTTIPAKVTSGTPISGQASTYWAASGQSIDLFHPWTELPRDAPPGAGNGTGVPGKPPRTGAPVAGPDGPLGPSDGTGGLGPCPFGYYRITSSVDFARINAFDLAISAGDTIISKNVPTVSSLGNVNNGIFITERYRVSFTNMDGNAESRDYSGVIGSTNGDTFRAPFRFQQTQYCCNASDGTLGACTSTRSYRVKPGDTLWDIAGRYYGDPTRWPDIYNANRGIIGSDPNLIYPGQNLTVPT